MRTTNRKIIILSLMGAGAFALTGCKEDTVNASVHQNEQACVSAGFDAASCASEFKAAQTTHDQTAPRYDSLAVCEEQHGAGACEAPVANSGSSGGIFMPMLAGYMVGSMLSNNSNTAAGVAGRVAPKPLYKSATGGYASADGKVTSPRLSGTSTTRASAMTRPSLTKNAAPMSRATVATRGGFGGARASFGG